MGKGGSSALSRHRSNMEIIEKTRPFQRHAFGSPWDKNFCKLSFGYTHTYKKVAAGTATAVLAATTLSTTTKTIISGITNPDVPRALYITMATAGGIGDGSAIITGTNVEGATITETFDIVDGTTGTTNGGKAFKTVSSIVVSPMKGTCTITVGTLNALGINHRLYPSNTTVKVIKDTGSARTVESSATITDADEQYVEKNLITPATTPDGTYFYTFYYIYDRWDINDLNDNPIYAYSTSTSSTSTSTSTTATPSTSTSSTSVSTSSTSSSTSSTSSSTSSTSTSTTTVP